MEDNKINFAKYQIYKYAEELFVCLCELIKADLNEAMNRPSHGLSEKELNQALTEFVEQRVLAERNTRQPPVTGTQNLEETESISVARDPVMASLS
ncbi:MAG: hypothetical protein P8179_13250 [Candidatus Thiodiazotropha sp.]